ncbi:hypothetical protein Tco_0687322 [Tanacetum coccineum]
MKEKTAKNTPPKIGKRGKVLKKVRKVKSPLRLMDEEEEIQQEPERQGESEDFDVERAINLSLDSSQARGEGEGEDYDYERAIKMSLDSFQSQSQEPVEGVAIREHVAEEIQNLPEVETVTKVQKVDKEQGEEASTTMAFEEKIADRAEDQAGPDPGKGHEALAGSNPEPMNEDFYAVVYTKVHENLKLKTNEHVILENPASPSRTISLMKNLDDTNNFRDHFLNDNPTKEEHANTSAPPLSTPIVDLTTSTPPPLQVHAPLITATTKTIAKILALPPPPPTQSSTEYELAARFADLEQRNAELERIFTIQNKTTNNIASRIFTLEHRDLEYRIDNYVRDAVRDSVQTALRAPLLQSFRDLSKVEMKEMLQQWMFKSGSHRTHPDHENLYEVLDRSIARDNQDELHEALSRSRKRWRDDQDPPPSPPSPKDD